MVNSQNAFDREIRLEHVFEASVETDTRVRYVAKGSMRNSDAEIGKDGELPELRTGAITQRSKFAVPDLRPINRDGNNGIDTRRYSHQRDIVSPQLPQVSRRPQYASTAIHLYLEGIGETWPHVVAEFINRLDLDYPFAWVGRFRNGDDGFGRIHVHFDFPLQSLNAVDLAGKWYVPVKCDSQLIKAGHGRIGNLGGVNAIIFLYI